jgi:hypothetical protein
MADANGNFAWAHGSRLCYANLTTEQGASDVDSFRGFEAIAVSRMDVPAGLQAGGAAAFVADEAN